MPSFQDSVFLFILALLLFGPKKLPVLARELGKWVGEFRRASNEFRMQMDDELRQSEQADRLKKIEAMEAAAPATAALPEATTTEAVVHEASSTTTGVASEEPSPVEVLETVAPVSPLPIAEAGEVKIMPPSTGLPLARASSALSGLLSSIPAAETRTENQVLPSEADTAETAHGH